MTINHRTAGFFRLDAHVDPIKDGPNVLILGLLSDTVLTLSRVGPPATTAADQLEVSLHSWAPDDFDALLPKNALLHLHGPARDVLNHGIRLGLTAEQLRARGVSVADDPSQDANNAKSPAPLFDYFGTWHHPVKRSPERISIVFAFADP